jgi:hypothetical protein
MNLKTFTMWTKQDGFLGKYQSLAVKGEKCTGGKMSKERLTVLLFIVITLFIVIMVGGMEKPLVNVKAAKPSCFKILKINHLPAIWRNNKRSLDDCNYNGRVVNHV